MLRTNKRKLLLLPTMLLVIAFAVAALTYTAIASGHSAQAAAKITSVTVNNGEITVHFDMQNYAADQVSLEFTIAKWVNEKVGWISMLQRNRIYEEGATEVIRAGNLRESVTKDKGGFAYTFKHRDNPIDFRDGAYWTHNKPAADGAYGDYINMILSEIERHGKWDPDAIYRIGVTSRQDERFTAVTYFTGRGTTVEAANVPGQSDALVSCLSCHPGAEFKAHSNRRHDQGLCLSCHNNFTYDSMNSAAEPDGWAKIDMLTMIHSIHAGIEGYKVAKTDYSNVPSFMTNCAACHGDTTPVPVRGY